MKWVLVYIIVTASQGPVAINAYGSDTFDDMNKCFMARDQLSETVGNGNGNFKPGQQAVCISIDK